MHGMRLWRTGRLLTWAMAFAVVGGARGVGLAPGVCPTNLTWAVEAYAGADWGAWEARVAADAEGLAAVAREVPPTPPGMVTYIEQTAEELPEALAACTNAAPSVLVGGVRAWDFRVAERVAADGARAFLTFAGETVFHAQGVPADFDAEAWALAAYTEDGRLPETVAGDAARREEWFAMRGRERLGLAYTFVERGRLGDYVAAREAEAAAREEAWEGEGAAGAWGFGVREMEVGAGEMAFGFCDPAGSDLYVLGRKSLEAWDDWALIGKVEAEGRRWVAFGLPMDMRFWKFLDASLDSDGDGIADGLEVGWFGTDPLRADTAGSLIDDWRKIYVYGMDARVADADGDGLPDGWELLNGLDPYAADAEGDPDGDGIANRLELAYGTDPQRADSDGDGLGDREETGWAEVTHGVGPVAAGTGRVALAEGVAVGLPAQMRLGGRAYARVEASRSGVVRLLGEFPIAIRVFPEGMTWPEAFRAGIFAWEAEEGFVIAFENVGLPGEPATTLGRAQVILRADSGGVEVRYTTLQGGLAALTGVGARRPDGRFGELLDPGTVTLGDCVTYWFGAGSDPTLPDTDGDGVEDGAEVAAGRSAPGPDDDFDGLPDRWERRFGLDPLSASGADGAAGDPDGDGLPNLREHALGTDPTAVDSDGDGLSDAAEVGAVTRRTHVAPMDTSAGRVVAAYDREATAGYVFFDLPFPVRVGGADYPRVGLNIDGVLTFVPAGETALRFPSARRALGETPLDTRYPSLALYWADLMVAEAFRSELRVVEMPGETVVVECLNLAKQGGFAFLAWPEPATALARIQVIIPRDADAAGIEVRYTTLQGGFDGAEATLGAQFGTQAIDLAHNLLGAVAIGDAITYHPGTGTDPARADTDGDGLDDAAELALGLDPKNPDLDGDGLADGWEVAWGLDPRVPDDHAADWDGDGISNYVEAQWGTNPRAADSDGDGVGDAAEIAQGSDPADASDEGMAGRYVKVALTFGDPSASASEKYAVEVCQTVGEGSGEAAPKRLENLISDGAETRELLLRPDAAYTVTLRHLSSKAAEADHDYTLTVRCPVVAAGTQVVIEDPESLLGTYATGGSATPDTYTGKAVTLYCLTPTLTPDHDRDLTFGPIDEAYAAAGIPLPVWVNSDHDHEDPEGVNDGSEASQPLPDNFIEGILSGAFDCDDLTVNGQSDLEDFFPVRLRLGAALTAFLAAHPQATAHLETGPWEGALHALWCHDGTESVQRFFDASAGGGRYGEEGREARWEAEVAELTDGLFGDRTRIPPQVLATAQASERGDVPLFVEACAEGTLTLRLRVREESVEALGEEGRILTECAFDSRFVEACYAVLNLREDTPQYVDPAVERAEKPDVTVCLVHGYNVSETDAAEWFNAVYKRLWRSGSTARFCGVVWRGDDQGVILPDYYRNVANAFDAAGAFATALDAIPGRKVVLAHSLGNMLVSAALQDHDAPIDAYFMLNSAVPAEAYDPAPSSPGFSVAGVPAGLIHDAWRNYDPRSWSALWHRHFLPHEGFAPTAADAARATLTWKGRFEDVLTGRGAKVFHVYSRGAGETSGDEVFELLGTTPSPLSGFDWTDLKTKSRHAWQKQECWKGRREASALALAASEEMGWGFDGAAADVSAEASASLGEATYRQAPLFCRQPPEILGDDPNAILDLRNTLLARAIPALSNAAGRTKMKIDQKQMLDLQMFISSFWPRRNVSLEYRWLHSDIKNIAYPHTRLFYNYLIEKGGLK